MIEMLNGLRVYVSSECLEMTNFPVREHVKKPWMKESYHKRIQKKWIKRFGWKMKPCMFISKINNSVYMHPEIYERMKALTLFDDNSGLHNNILGVRMQQGVR